VEFFHAVEKCCGRAGGWAHSGGMDEDGRNDVGIMTMLHLERVLARGAGWLDAFGELVRLHEGWVRAYLRTRISDWAAADDLAQEVFLTAFRRIRSYRGEGGFEAWLRGIAHNHLRNFVRKRRESYIGGAGELEEAMDAAGGEAGWQAPEHRALEAMRACLVGIDGPARELLEQRYVVGRTVREISASSGRGYSALTMQLHRLRETLAECIRRKMEVAGS